jgi:hypothetical protein
MTSLEVLQALNTLTNTILSVVTQFFPAVTAKARLIGNMSAVAGMPPIIFVRMYWAKQHPGLKFTNTEYEQLELIDIYLQFPPLNWRDDQYITDALKDRMNSLIFINDGSGGTVVVDPGSGPTGP